MDFFGRDGIKEIKFFRRVISVEKEVGIYTGVKLGVGRVGGVNFFLGVGDVFFLW